MIFKKVEISLILSSLICLILFATTYAKYIVMRSFGPMLDDMEFSAAEPRPVVLNYMKSSEVLPIEANVKELNTYASNINEKTLQLPLKFAYDQVHEATVQEIVPDHYKYIKQIDSDDTPVGDGNEGTHELFRELDQSENVDPQLSFQESTNVDASLKSERNNFNESKKRDKLYTSNSNTAEEKDVVHKDNTEQYTGNDEVIENFQEESSNNNDLKQSVDENEQKESQNNEQYSKGNFSLFI